jgi:hypothetical protein
MAALKPLGPLLAAAALASCQPVVPAGVGGPEAGEAVPAPAVASLAGEWRVAGIDGVGFNEPYGLALSGDGERLWWQPICARQGRRYRIAGGAIAVSPLDPPPRAGEPPAPVCRIAIPPRLAEVMRALDAARTVERTPQNGILLAGGGHSLLLFSQ